jgi:hypothetical protein
MPRKPVLKKKKKRPVGRPKKPVEHDRSKWARWPKGEVPKSLQENRGVNPGGPCEALKGPRKPKREAIARMGHGKNRLPKDHPLREQGFTLDIYKAYRVMVETGMITDSMVDRRFKNPIRRLKEAIKNVRDLYGPTPGTPGYIKPTKSPGDDS